MTAPTSVEDWACRTMLATYGVFTCIGFFFCPMLLLLPLYLIYVVSEIFHRGLSNFDLPSFLILSGIVLFAVDLFMLDQFWRLCCRRATLLPPTVLWLCSLLATLCWTAWWLTLAFGVAVPDSIPLCFCFLIWPCWGLVLSGSALYSRIRITRLCVIRPTPRIKQGVSSRTA